MQVQSLMLSYMFIKAGSSHWSKVNIMKGFEKSILKRMDKLGETSEAWRTSRIKEIHNLWSYTNITCIVIQEAGDRRKMWLKRKEEKCTQNFCSKHGEYKPVEEFYLMEGLQWNGFQRIVVENITVERISNKYGWREQTNLVGSGEQQTKREKKFRFL
jgi:hypothetical protein